MKRKVEYDFVQYPIPKVGLFRLETDKWQSPGGWVRKEEKCTIIGETEHHYVYKIVESEQGEWVGKKVIKHTYLLPMGIHKTRLIRWFGQLSLFE